MSYLHDLLASAAKDCPGVIAVQDERFVWTYSELDRQAKTLAGALQSHGVEPGDRVAVLSKNRAEFVALYFAASLVGAILTPLNWRLVRDELLWIVTDAAPALLIVEERFRIDAAPCHTVTFDQLENAGGSMSVAETTGNEVVLMYTSGTSGRPKGALLTHENCLTMTSSWLEDMTMPKGAKFLQVTPLFHVGGLLMMLSNTSAQTSLRLLEEFDPVRAIDVLAQEQITHTLMVPAMLQWLMQEPHLDGKSFPSLQLVVYGAAPMTRGTLEKARDLFACDFLQGYGLTETAGVLLTLTPKDHSDSGATGQRLLSCGRAASVCEVRVVDAAGKDIAPSSGDAKGEVGEIVARGSNISSSYWRAPEASREVWRGGWFHTGDLARIDTGGYITVVDRIKDMILVGGENVYPMEVERVLLSSALVSDVAVLGIPHGVWGEEVLAMVVLSPGQVDNTRALIKHCRNSLARFKCPTRIEYCLELPRNAAGKLMKRALRSPYWEGQERSV